MYKIAYRLQSTLCSQWKKDECILLSSEDEDLENKIMQRNKYVMDYINNHGYELSTEENDDAPVSDQVKNFEGRAIVLKKDSERICCWANGYKTNQSQTGLENYSTFAEP